MRTLYHSCSVMLYANFHTGERRPQHYFGGAPRYDCKGSLSHHQQWSLPRRMLREERISCTRRKGGLKAANAGMKACLMRLERDGLSSSASGAAVGEVDGQREGLEETANRSLRETWGTPWL